MSWSFTLCLRGLRLASGFGLMLDVEKQESGVCLLRITIISWSRRSRLPPSSPPPYRSTILSLSFIIFSSFMPFLVSFALVYSKGILLIYILTKMSPYRQENAKSYYSTAKPFSARPSRNTFRLEAMLTNSASRLMNQRIRITSLRDQLRRSESSNWPLALGESGTVAVLSNSFTPFTVMTTDCNRI